MRAVRESCEGKEGELTLVSGPVSVAGNWLPVPSAVSLRVLAANIPAAPRASSRSSVSSICASDQYSSRYLR